MNNVQKRNEQVQQQQKQVTVQPPQPPKDTFKLPHVTEGEHVWNIYRVPNSILNGKQDNDVHGGLVLNEQNGKLMLVEVTHSDKQKGKRNNIPVRNLCSTDIDKKAIPPKLRDSYLVRKLVVSVERHGKEEGIDTRALLAQMNDLHFTDDEQKAILDKLSHLSTAEEKYNKFIELAKKKNDTE